jgi:hypothetical protein
MYFHTLARLRLLPRARMKYSLYEMALNFKEKSEPIGSLSAGCPFVSEKALSLKLLGNQTLLRDVSARGRGGIPLGSSLRCKS